MEQVRVPTKEEIEAIQRSQMMAGQQFSQMASALSLVQKEIKSIKKETINPFFKSKYAELSAVCDYLYPILSKHGFSVTQPPVIVDGKLYIKTMLMHSSGASIEAVWPVTGDRQQEMGSATSYARRYSLMAVVGLAATGEDDDGEAESKDDKNHLINELKQTASTLKVSSEDVLNYIKTTYNKSRVSDLNLEEIDKLTKWMKTKKG